MATSTGQISVPYNNSDMILAKVFRRILRLGISFILPWSLFIATLDPIRGQEESYWESRAKDPVPDGAKVTLEIDRCEYFLGEEVWIHFVLENTSKEPFEASFGHDYRGSDRQLRFKVTATDENGQVAEAPYTSAHDMGGLGGPRVLKPGEKFNQSLALMRYCRIEKPGNYTIRITHDFGWKESERKRPVGETKITFRMPSPDEAEQICRMLAALEDEPNSMKEDRPDFRCLRFPVYIDVLADMARKGDKRAIEGLRYIPTIEASQSLIKLAGEPDKEVALQSAKVLYERVPIPEAQYTRNLPGSTEPPKLTIRGQLVERAWDDSLIPEVRGVATKLLASEDLPTIASGALLIVSVGTLEDATSVLNAIIKSRESINNPREKPDDNILDLPQPVRELLRAMDTLYKRGYSVDEVFIGEGEILSYFHFLNGTPSPRSERWLDHLTTFGASGWYPIRVEALRSIPKPMPAECRDYVKERLEDQDLGVCREACNVAGESGRSEFISPLLEIVAAERHEWLLREASQAAQKLGAGYDLYVTWADRLHEAGIYNLALDSLQSILDIQSGSYSGRTDLKREARLKLRDTWKKFLLQHSEEIRSGKRFKVTDPAVTPALAGDARIWRLPDGTSWPETMETRQPK